MEGVEHGWGLDHWAPGRFIGKTLLQKLKAGVILVCYLLDLEGFAGFPFVCPQIHVAFEKKATKWLQVYIYIEKNKVMYGFPSSFSMDKAVSPWRKFISHADGRLSQVEQDAFDARGGRDREAEFNGWTEVPGWDEPTSNLDSQVD